MDTKRALVSLLAAVAIGWLGSGTCTVSYCYEDCDPCFQQCKCQKQCQQSSAAFKAAHALVVYEVVDEIGDEGAFQRNFVEIRGIRARTGTDAADCVRCARGVLLVNEHLIRRNASELTLQEVERCASGTLLRFERDHGGNATDLVTFFFDPHGYLTQITHDARGGEFAASSSGGTRESGG